MQAILTGVVRRDPIVGALAKAFKAECVKGADRWDGESIPIVMGNTDGCDLIQMQRIKENKPYIYVDHGYFTRGYANGVFRICLSHFHCADWRPSDRPWSGKMLPWHKGSHIIVIPPSAAVARIYGAGNWVDTVIDYLKKRTDRRIIVKPKGEMDLQVLCREAHALISYGSVAEVEAAMMGVPVFSEKGPGKLISGDMEQIEWPVYPDREPWLGALAAAQWHIKEFHSAAERLAPLI
jgi:hypothetical protein